jgi:AraC-like DNA-binding protein
VILLLSNYYSDTEKYLTYIHKKNIKPGNWDYHLHDSYEIYILLQGSMSYFIGKTIYNLKAGDLVILNSREIHTHSLHEDKNYDRVLLLFDPKLAQLFNSPDFDLLSCFENRSNGERNKLSLNTRQLQELLSILNKIEGVNSDKLPADKTLKLSYFIELLVFLNKVFVNNKDLTGDAPIHEKLLPILNYIDANISGDLSLDTLEMHFYINKYYLCRLFKAHVGITIHKYIVLKRIVHSKALLAQGYDVTNTCYMSGFKDYSNFIKMFKSIVGISPAKYRDKGTGVVSQKG